MNNSNDLISRNSAIEAYLDADPEATFTEILDSIPAVDAVPVVRGFWIDENPDDFLDPRLRCSICIANPLIKWRYCPNCGAKMDGLIEE